MSNGTQLDEALDGREVLLDDVLGAVEPAELQRAAVEFRMSDDDVEAVIATTMRPLRSAELKVDMKASNAGDRSLRDLRGEDLEQVILSKLAINGCRDLVALYARPRTREAGVQIVGEGGNCFEPAAGPPPPPRAD